MGPLPPSLPQEPLLTPAPFPRLQEVGPASLLAELAAARSGVEAFEFPDGQLQMGWRGREVDGVGSRPGSSSLSHCAPGWRGEEPNLFSKEMQLWFRGVHISHLWLVFPRVLRGEYRVSPCHQDRFAVTLATSSAAHWLPLLLLPARLPKVPCRRLPVWGRDLAAHIRSHHSGSPR